MQNIKIAIGADHRGFTLKQFLITHKTVANHNITWQDCGTNSQERTDYPIYTWPVTDAVKSAQVDYGILLCGSGIGMSIAANRCSKIYAGLVWNSEVAKAAKEDDNVNVLVLPADFLNQDQTIKIITAWLSAKFKGDRYLARLEQIDRHF